MERTTTEFSSETEKMTSYSNSTSTSTSTSSETTILSTKEINRLISDTKLDESIFEVFPFGEPVFPPDPDDLHPLPENGNDFPPLLIDEGSIERCTKKKEETPLSKMKSTSKRVGNTDRNSPKSPTIYKIPENLVCTCSAEKMVKSSGKGHSYTDPTISTQLKSIGSFPIASKSPEPESHYSQVSSPTPCQGCKGQEQKTREMCELSIQVNNDEFSSKQRFGQQSSESEIASSDVVKSVLKSLDKDKSIRPNSLQIPIDMEYELNTTSKGATKCITSRKLSFESPVSGTGSPENYNFGKILPNMKSKTQSNGKKNLISSPAPSGFGSAYLLTTTKTVPEHNLSTIAVACQTQPCIVTPVSSIKTLSISQNIHRHNLYNFSNQIPSFLRSTIASRAHNMSPPPRVIEEVKYLKETSLLAKKSSSLPSVVSTSPSTPRKSVTKQQQRMNSPKKLDICSSSSKQPKGKPKSNSNKLILNSTSESQNYSINKGQIISDFSPSYSRVRKNGIESQTKLASPAPILTSFSKMTASRCSTPTSSYKTAESKSAHPPAKSLSKTQDSSMNWSTYISPTLLTSFSKYVDNGNHIFKNAAATNSTPSKLSTSKVVVTSISPTTTDCKDLNSKRSNSFNYFNSTSTGGNSTSKISSTKKKSISLTGSASFQKESSPSSKRVSELGLRSNSQINGPLSHSHRISLYNRNTNIRVLGH